MFLWGLKWFERRLAGAQQREKPKPKNALPAYLEDRTSGPLRVAGCPLPSAPHAWGGGRLEGAGGGCNFPFFVEPHPSLSWQPGGLLFVHFNGVRRGGVA